MNSGTSMHVALSHSIHRKHAMPRVVKAISLIGNLLIAALSDCISQETESKLPKTFSPTNAAVRRGQADPPLPHDPALPALVALREANRASPVWTFQGRPIE